MQYREKDLEMQKIFEDRVFDLMELKGYKNKKARRKAEKEVRKLQRIKQKQRGQ